MNEGPSFSFLSQHSQRHPIVSFNSFEGGSNPYLKEIQGSKRVASPSMSNNFQILLLLQAAEIERLTTILNAYKNKLDQIPTSSKDISFPNASIQLSQNEIQKGARTNSKAMNESVQSQGRFSMASLSMGSVTDVNLYLEKLEGKYKRALRYVEENAAAREYYQNAYLEAKQQLSKTQQNFEAFKTSSIQQYQLLRQQLDNSKRDELSFEVKEIKSEKERLLAELSKEKSELSMEKKKLEGLMQQEKDRLKAARTEIDKLSLENEEYRKIIQRAQQKYRELLNQKENSTALAGLEIERLNSVIKQKALRLKEAESSLYQHQTNLGEEINLLKRELDRGKTRNMQLQQEISKQQMEAEKLTAQIGVLTRQLRDVQISNQQRLHQNQMKQSMLNRELRNLNQTLSSTETHYQQQIEEQRASNARLTQQLAQTKERVVRLEDASKNQEFAYKIKLQEFQSQLLSLTKQKNQAHSRFLRAEQEAKAMVGQAEKRKKDMESVLVENQRLMAIKQQMEKRASETQRGRFSQKIVEMEKRIAEYEDNLRIQSRIEMELASQNESLKAALNQSERSKNNILKSRSFDQLFQEIQTLCASVRQKQTYIQSLEQEMKSLSDSSKKALRETVQLREMLFELLNMFQNFQTNRKDDQTHLLEQMRRLFQGEASLIQDLKKTQEEAYSAIHRQHPLMQQYQTRLISSKESQIESLRERVNHLQAQSFQKGNMQQIVAKIIELTKENSELKAIAAAKESEVGYLSQLNQKLQEEMSNNLEKYQRTIRQKQNAQQKILAQLEEANSVLMEERQNQIKLQAVRLELESLQKYSEHQLQSREQLIQELKGALKQKNEHSSQAASAFEQEIYKSYNLQLQINQLKQDFSLETSKKGQELENLAQKLHKTKNENERLHSSISTLEQEKVALLTVNQSFKEQMKQLKDQNQTLIHLKSKPASSGCRHCSGLQQIISNLDDEVSRLRAELKILRAENMAFREQENKQKQSMLGYADKIPILNAQFSRLELVIEELKQRNSQLVLKNHYYQIELEKEQHNKQKLAVLNQELLRLQSQNVDLVEEVNVYRLEFSQEVNQERQTQEFYSTLVLLFVQVESLRSRLQLKEKQVEQINLKLLRL